MNSINNRVSYSPSFCAKTGAAKQVVEQFIGHTVEARGTGFPTEVVSTFGPDGKFIGQSVLGREGYKRTHKFVGADGKVHGDSSFYIIPES